MTIQDWGAVGEIFGAIGVLITLIYLARQIKHSADVSKVTSYHDAVHQIVESSKDPEFGPLLKKIERDENLTPDEEARSLVLSTIFIYGHEILLHLHGKGQVDDELWKNIIINNMPLLESAMILPVLRERSGPISKRLLALVEDEKYAA